MSAVSQSFSYKMIGDVFCRNLEKNRQTFSDHITTLVKGVCAASEGRICSPKLVDEEVFTSMVDKLYESYERDDSLDKLANNKLFKILSTNTSQLAEEKLHTEETSQFLARKTSQQMKYVFGFNKEICSNDAVKKFCYGVFENIVTADAVRNQIKIFKNAEEKAQDIFHKEHAKVQAEHFDELRKLTKNQMKIFILRIENPDTSYEFNQPQSEKMEHLVGKMEEFLSKGGKYMDVFRARIVAGLEPVLVKYSAENPQGTPELEIITSTKKPAPEGV